MATAAIVINQAGRPQATPGMSRSDLRIGVAVVLTNHDNTDAGSWTWEFVAVPAGSKAMLNGSTNPIAMFTPDVAGSYMVKLTVGGPDGPVSDRRIAAARTPFLGLRAPLAAERGEIDPAHNQWSAVQEAFDLVDADAARSLKIDGSNSAKADISWKGHRITDLGGLELDGALRLGRTRDPEAVEGKAFLYLRDVGNGTDLFYCAPDGSMIRLTRDGRLNVPASFDDRLKLSADDDKPGYLNAKVGAANGLAMREIDGFLWVEPVCGSEPGTLCAGDDPRLSRPVVVQEQAPPQPSGTETPAPHAAPLADNSGKLDAWVSEAAPRRPGRMALGRDLGGAAATPEVVGLRGKPIPAGEGLLRIGGSRIELVPCGSAGGTVCVGDDPRLSDPRPPAGEAGGQLAGSFPAPRVVGITEGEGRQLVFGAIPEGCVLVRRADRLVGVDPSGRRAIAMVLNESTESDQETIVGCFPLDGGKDTSPMVFQAVCRVTKPGLRGVVRLRNATDGVLVAELGVAETSFATKRTNGFRPPAGKKLYEVAISLVDAGSQPGERLICMWAGLLTDQYM